MAGLTSKQKDELNQAILEYLVKNKFTQSAEIFAEECCIQPDGKGQNGVGSSSGSLIKDVLEKKWTSVAKLKRQVMDLEKQNKQLKEQQICERCGGGTSLSQGGGMLQSVGDGLPRQPEKHVLLGHRQRITKVVMHPIYQIVASSSDDGSIKLWDFEQGELENTMKSHTGCVNYISFHPNGKFLASCATDQTIKLWDLQTHSVFKTLQGHEHEVSCVEYLPGGDTLVSCSRDNTIKFWDSASGYCQRTIQAHSDWIRKVALNTKGTLLASASKDESIIVWNLERLRVSKTQQQEQESIIAYLKEHENQIDSITWAPPEACITIDNADYNKNFLAMLTMQNQDVQGSGDLTGSTATPGQADLSQSQPVEEVKDNIASGGGTEKLSTKEKIQQMKAKMQARKKKDEGAQPEEEKKQASNQIVLSDDIQRDYLASAARDKTIKIWEVRNSRCVITLVGHDNWVTDLVFHPVGKYLLSSSDDKSIRIWDLSNGRCYRKIQNAHDHFVSTIDMKAKMVVTGSVDKTLKVWACR